jgi:hypothetical protein
MTERALKFLYQGNLPAGPTRIHFNRSKSLDIIREMPNCIASSASGTSVGAMKNAS